MSDLLSGKDIADMTNAEWECAQEILRSWDLLCNDPAHAAAHIAGLKYWGEFYVFARDPVLAGVA